MAINVPTNMPVQTRAWGNVWPYAAARLSNLFHYVPRAVKSNATFKLSRYFYYQRYRSMDAPPEAASVVDQLRRDGIVIIPDYFPIDRLAPLRAEIMPALDRLLAGDGTLRENSWVSDEYGIARLLKIDKRCETSKAFFNDSFVNTVAKAYVSEDVQSFHRFGEVRATIGAVSSSDIRHFDDWRIRFKAWLLLDDIDEGRAPMVYYKGSHVRRPWRVNHDFEYYRDGLTGTGRAGTLILADTRGVHRGSPVRTGPRYLLANYFEVRKLQWR